MRFGRTHDVRGLSHRKPRRRPWSARAKTARSSCAFDFSGAVLDEAIESLGETPLPPYIAARREATLADRASYQTMFAEPPARSPRRPRACTSRLHLIERLQEIGASLHRVTLHVGGGTFLPVKSEDTAEHRMHAEWGRIDAETAEALNAVRARGGRIVAIGTTSLRLLESAAAADGRLRRVRGRDRHLHHAGLRFSRCRRAVHEFSSCRARRC